MLKPLSVALFPHTCNEGHVISSALFHMYTPVISHKLLLVVVINVAAYVNCSLTTISGDRHKTKSLIIVCFDYGQVCICMLMHIHIIGGSKKTPQNSLLFSSLFLPVNKSHYLLVVMNISIFISQDK